MPGQLIWGWDEIDQRWREIRVDENGILRVGNTTPEDLRVVIYGYHAGTGVYLPVAVDDEGRIITAP